MNKEEISKKVEELLAKMTVREKVGQLNQCGNSIYNEDYSVGWQLLREGRIGSFLGITTVEKANELQKTAVEETRLGIPLLLGYDVIHGYRTIFPVPWGESCSWEPELAEKTSAAAAAEAAANGVSWIYAPMIDIARDSRWGRGVEGSGEDTYLTSAFAKARVKGTQGEDLSDGRHAAACAKHFVGYGACIGGRDYNSVDISEQTLYDVYIPPFQAAVDAGCKSIMTAFHDLNGEPCTGSRHLITEVLRGELGFSGTVISDAGSCDQLKIHGYTEDDKDTARTAINAGLDVEMCFGIFTYQENLEDLVAEGSVSMETLDNAVRRVLTLKYELGLFENPYRSVEAAEAAIYTKEAMELALESAKRSVVLLENDGTLPIKKDSKILLTGPFADNGTEMLGIWAGLGEGERSVTPKSAIGGEVICGCGLTEDNGEADNALEAARNADVVIAFIGEPSSMNGEGRSRTHNTIPEVQLELLRKLRKNAKKLVSVVIGGRPLVLTEVKELSDAVLFSGALGTMAGEAYRQIIFGEYNPSAKLVNTFPTVVGQTPLYYNMKNTGKPPVEEFFWTSKYMDAPIPPLYPFGYGLSYTDFEYGNLQISKSEADIGEKLTVSADIKNTGICGGEEVVQLYVHDVTASLTRPIKELKGFKKLFIGAGETKKAEFELDTNELGFRNRKNEYVVEPGKFEIMVGTDSENLIKLEINLK